MGTNVGTSSSAVAVARIGRTVAGKYRLNRLIGQGAMGAVYAAVHQFTGRHVALKLINPDVASYEGYAARFLREARAAADIGHPAICDVIDAGQEPDGALYLALELLEGRTLEAAIDSHDLRQEEIVRVGIQLLEGLAAAHDRGIVHRDIKPDNVFLTWDEEGELHVKLLDFGVAKNTKGGPDVFRTQQGAVLGTPYYMSPEQAAGDPVDVRADIWSTGAVLFHTLTGRPPFEEETYNRLIAKLLKDDPPRLCEVRPDLPEWLGTAVDGALQRDVGARWQSARTMAETLRLTGKAPIDLDWEAHEDATVRTDSFYDPGEDERPALAAIAGNDAPNIEIDVELTGARPAVTHAAARIRTEPPPAMQPAAGPRRGSGLLLGILLGVAISAAVTLALGYFLIYPRLAPPAPPEPAPSAAPSR